MRRLHLAIYVLFLALFGVLGYLAHQFRSFPGDTAVSEWLREASLPLFASLMESVSDFGETIPAVITVALVAALLLLYRRKIEAAFAVVLPALAALLNYSFKLLVDRPRPGDELLAGGMSFPSGHTTYAAVLGGFIFYLAPRLLGVPVAARTLQGLAVLFVLLTGISRVYLEAHQPSDILGSFLLSGLLLVPAIALYERLSRQRRERPEVRDARTT